MIESEKIVNFETGKLAVKLKNEEVSNFEIDEESKQKTQEELEHMRKVIRLALIRVGVRSDLTGFKYLCYAVERVALEPSLIHNLCKGLYVEIAENFEVANSGSVERGIRHAIDVTLDEKTFVVLNQMFNAMLFEKHEKPTSGEFIRLMAEYYLLDLYKEWV